MAFLLTIYANRGIFDKEIETYKQMAKKADNTPTGLWTSQKLTEALEWLQWGQLTPNNRRSFQRTMPP